MADGLTINLTGLDGVLDTLRSLPPEVVSKRGGPVKSALRKGAVVIFKQAKTNLEAAVANATDEGKKTSTGLLAKNLVVTRGKEPRSTKGERYLVRVRKKSYQRNGAQITTQKTAALLEYGTGKQPAEPWIRPAFASKAQAAISTIEKELVTGVDRIVKKLSAQNKGR